MNTRRGGPLGAILEAGDHSCVSSVLRRAIHTHTLTDSSVSPEYLRRGFESSVAATVAVASEDCSAQQEAVWRRDGLAGGYGFLNEHNFVPGVSPGMQCDSVQVN